MKVTIEQYEQLPAAGVRTELVDGEVVELATGSYSHGWTRDQIRAALLPFGFPGAEVEFRTKPGTVRRADAVWYSSLKPEDWSRSLMPVPDLAVEVLSPSDSANGMRTKVREYFEAGVSTVWVVYLETRDADVWNRDGRFLMGVRELTADCLPGFSLPIESVLPPSPPPEP